MSANNNDAGTTKLKDFPVSVEELIALTPIIVKEKQRPVFTLALAHEIRNPLTNINLSVDLLQSATSDEERKIFLDIIARSTIRINSLIADLLEAYEAVAVPLEIHSVNKLLDEILFMTGDRIILKNIIVKRSYTERDCNILVNKPQIIIALINIIINAIDAMSPGKGQLKIITRTIISTCTIEIEDNGIGISKEKLKNIFKPYFTDKPGGMGLGLSTTLTTLLSNHARVKVYSEEGKGTRFILFFEKISAVDEIIK